MKLVLRPAAEQDIAEAMLWYDAQGQDLSDAILAQVEASFARILQGPERYPTAYGTFRRALVRRFPYLIYFRVEVDDIVVFAVYHQRRDPDALRARLEP